MCECGIKLQNCVAHTYDGASVMKGSVNGVQSLFRKEVPQAIYTHCANHRLNLVIVDVCKNVQTAENFFSFLQKLYVFMSESAIHSFFVSVQREMGQKTVELKALSETRWICQSAVCDAVKRALSAIIITLHRLVEGRGTRAQEAQGLLNSIDMEILVYLCIFSVILKEIHIVSRVFQSKECDVGQAHLLVERTTDHLKTIRNSREHFGKIWQEACALKEENGIEGITTIRKRRLPEHLAKFVVMEHTNAEVLTSEDDFY